MTRRTIVVDSEIWKVFPTGRVTVYGKDEFGLLFELGTGLVSLIRRARSSSGWSAISFGPAPCG